ncbi:SPOR domain-containing protein [Desulfovibrio inopinatus]|uniref:SPOR domain-containing protein n=1 Tax=Desulfovibrio inopinatus TaxID=102109 RepID=UPI0004264BEF|nr:hypothetical protein [Desulfovibrio inopinatus]
MKIFSRLNMSQPDNGPRKFSIELTMSGLVSIAVVVVLGVAWVFILGVLVGRGYKPEKAVPELAQILPTTESSESLGSASSPEVLKPEELGFMESLRDKGDVDGPAVSQAPAVALTPEPAKPLVVKPKPTPTPAPRVEEPRKPAVVETPVQDERYSITYQVASFYEKNRANTFLSQISKKGVTGRIENAQVKGKPVFRIIVTLSGSMSDIEAKLDAIGVKKPMQRKKTKL